VNKRKDYFFFLVYIFLFSVLRTLFLFLLPSLLEKRKMLQFLKVARKLLPPKIISFKSGGQCSLTRLSESELTIFANPRTEKEEMIDRKKLLKIVSSNKEHQYGRPIFMDSWKVHFTFEETLTILLHYMISLFIFYSKRNGKGDNKTAKKEIDYLVYLFVQIFQHCDSSNNNNLWSDSVEKVSISFSSALEFFNVREEKENDNVDVNVEKLMRLFFRQLSRKNLKILIPYELVMFDVVEFHQLILFDKKSKHTLRIIYSNEEDEKRDIKDSEDTRFKKFYFEYHSMVENKKKWFLNQAYLIGRYIDPFFVSEDVKQKYDENLRELSPLATVKPELLKLQFMEGRKRYFVDWKKHIVDVSRTLNSACILLPELTTIVANYCF
jgi:hypothetical protein